MQIIIAWVEEAQELVKAGRHDLGESHKFRTVLIPRSLMWLNNGKAEDIAKAARYAESEGYSVLLYTNESDPLGRARREVMAL